ncbi:MAG: ABC transporter ATP-binding protein [Methylotenera sp.]|nr:ABC transporter ATP-binding protein [Methylotenera sp.]MDO9233735.1 ABC transporter ATP-binding protein [Methylotenera sp.]MDO9388433.1 ABC transporter ATP-binding protein [Methylotenera sp.]MDP2102512.1 ABC transporter ATP-binding protein [Methylotenera sp.]MDP2280217.1 ABC transporter ATP-binding protein [Methylotenera sp.]
MTLLSIKLFSCAFEGKKVLQSLNLTVEKGQVLSILGSNGAGKSTLLKCILGLTDKNAQLDGDIEISGHSVFQQPLLAREQLAYVPEQPAVYGHLSALENIRYFLSLSSTSQVSAPIEAYLKQVGLLQEAWDRPCSEYSKGMKQKVMLALALAKQAKLLLMDEPNSGLDPQATDELNQIILQCKNNGMGVLVVTHDVLSAMSFSDQLYMLSNAQLQPISIDQSTLTLDNLKKMYQGQA